MDNGFELRLGHIRSSSMIKEKISHPSYATNLPRKEILHQNFFICDQLYTSRVSGYPIEIAWGHQRNFSHGHHDGYEISY